MAHSFTAEQYRYIVEKLAEGESPAGVVSDFCRRWSDLRLDIPDIAAFRRDLLPADWQAHFDAHRAAFEAAALAKEKPFRIALLDRMAREAAGKGSLELAAKLLEQIAKEEAGFYAGKAPPVAPVTTAEPIAITRTVIDPAEPKHSDAAGVPAAAATEPV